MCSWLKTIEEGIHTPDIYTEDRSSQKVSTTEFTEAIIDRMGSKPTKLSPVTYETQNAPKITDLDFSRSPKQPSKNQTRELVGVDVFVYWEPESPDTLAEILQDATPEGFELTMITNRGTKVWPQGLPQTFCTDHWRCRFKSTSDETKPLDVVALQQSLAEGGIDIIKTENLYEFDGEKGYSLGQGE